MKKQTGKASKQTSHEYWSDRDLRGRISLLKIRSAYLPSKICHPENWVHDPPACHERGQVWPRPDRPQGLLQPHQGPSLAVRGWWPGAGQGGLHYAGGGHRGNVIMGSGYHNPGYSSTLQITGTLSDLYRHRQPAVQRSYEARLCNTPDSSRVLRSCMTRLSASTPSPTQAPGSVLISAFSCSDSWKAVRPAWRDQAGDLCEQQAQQGHSEAKRDQSLILSNAQFNYLFWSFDIYLLRQ